MELSWVDIDKCKPNSYNPNVMEKERFEALCDFLKTHGAEDLDPIWVTKNMQSLGEYEIVDGEHRWKAAKKVGWKRLRAFVKELDEGSAKAFNVRKNRERGRLNPFKLGKLFLEDYEDNIPVEKISKKYGYLVNGKKGRASVVYNLIDIAKHQKEIIQRLKDEDDSATVESCSYKHALRLLRELKHPESEEPQEGLDIEDLEQPIETKTLEKFLTRYAHALKKNPLPNVQNDEVQTAIEFFKKILKHKKIHCPICGEEHLQWSCGHEF